MRSERIQLTPKQANIYAWGWQPEARYRFAPCGRRFGKTFLASEEMRRAARLAMEWGVGVENEIWYGAPTFKQAKRVFWNTLKRSIPSAWIAHKPNESYCTITLTTGHILRVVGLDDPDSLRGSGLWFFVGDEWDDAKDEVWPEVIRPMLSTAGGHALFIGSPKGFSKLYNGYIKGQPGNSSNTRSWTYTTIQGGNVPAKEVEEARSELDARTFRQEYEASFETFSGQVYYAFSRAQSVRPCAYDPTLRLHIGMDFNINPMSATCWQEVGSEVWQVGEVVIPTANTHDMTEEIIKRYGKPGIEHITIYPDPAGAQRRTSAQGKTDISILREKGFAVNALSSHPLVRDRINAVNSKFQTADGDRHAFVDPSCVKSIECLERQVYKEGTSDPDKLGGFDHLNDASGYYIYTRFGGHGHMSVSELRL